MIGLILGLKDVPIVMFSMDDFLLTLSAVKDSIIGFFRMRVFPLLLKRVFWVVLAFVVLILSCFFLFFGFEGTEALKEPNLTELQERAESAEQRANEEAARAEEAEKQFELLRQETDQVRKMVREMTLELSRLQVSYEKRKQKMEAELEAETDGASLRDRNCRKRTALGYPCPER